MKSLAAALLSPLLRRIASCFDRRIERLLDDPARAVVLADHLGQRDEANLGIAGFNELEGLGDILPLYDLGLELLENTKLLHCLDRRRAIGRGRWICDRHLGELRVLQCLWTVHRVLALAEQNEFANRVSELRARHREALVGRAFCGRLIGRQEHIEGGALTDLREEAPGRTKAEDRLVTGLLLPCRGDLLGGIGKGCRHRDLGFFGIGRGETPERRQGSWPQSASSKT